MRPAKADRTDFKSSFLPSYRLEVAKSMGSIYLGFGAATLSFVAPFSEMLDELF